MKERLSHAEKRPGLIGLLDARPMPILKVFENRPTILSSRHKEVITYNEATAVFSR